jgi:hypothetical protein
MKRLIVLLFFLLLMSVPVGRVIGQADSAITTPASGSAIQGKVDVSGYIKSTNFARYELDFSHGPGSEDGWFNITTGDKNPADGLLGVWDTSSISDGNYRLRLTVFYKDSTKAEYFADEIRVRNYSPIETDTPAPGALTNPTQETSIKPTFQAPVFQGESQNSHNIEITSPQISRLVVMSLIGGIILAFILAAIFRKQ